jgi:hypothetical protein
MHAINEDPENQNHKIIVKERFRADPFRWVRDYCTKRLDSGCGEVNKINLVILGHPISHSKSGNQFAQRFLNALEH